MVDRLHDIIDAMTGHTVAVLGDYMLDRYIWGSVTRISPEAPVPVVEVEREDAVPGGAGNVVRNLAALGLIPLVCGTIGQDPAGETLAGQLEAMGGDLTPLVQSPGRSTTHKTRVIANRQQVVRVDYDYNDHPTGALHEELVERTVAALHDADAVIFSDYAKGTLTGEVSAAILSKAREMELMVCVDPKPDHIQRFKGATLISPNEREAAAATGMRIDSDESAIRAAQKLQHDACLHAAVITRGDKGMCIYVDDGTAHLIPAVPTEVFDVTGAGDTAISVLCACLASGASLLEAAIIANVAGGEVVRQIGCATTSVEELHDAIDARVAIIDEVITRTFT